MAPELIPLAAPVPLPSWFEWLKVIAPPIITGLVVLAGAYITYRFANRGRREEILYKERYKGFEEISGYLHSIEDFSLKYNKKLDELENYLDETISSEDLILISQEIISGVSELLSQRPNNKYLTLQHEGASVDYYGVINSLDILKELAEITSGYTFDDTIESDEIKKEAAEPLKEQLYSIRISTYETVQVLLEHLKLPKR